MTIELPDPEWYLDNVVLGSPRERMAGPAELWQQWWSHKARVVEPIAAKQGFVLTVGQARDSGITRSRMRTLLEHGEWTSAGYGVVAPVDIRGTGEDFDVRALVSRRAHALTCAGAVLRREQDVVSGRSTAVLRGLPTLWIPPKPELTVRTSAGLGRRIPAHTYGATIRRDEVADWFGVATETVARTLVTLARHGRRDAIIAADAALREKLVTVREIERALETARGWPWVRQARSVLALASDLAESPLESITRLALHDSGFPPPDEQVWIGADRVDFYWKAYRYVLEADGRGKYTGDALWKEKKREARLRRNREVDVIERVIWSDIIDDWPSTNRRLWAPIHAASHPGW